MRSPHRGALVIAAVLLAALPAGAAAAARHRPPPPPVPPQLVPKNRAAARHIALENRAYRVINQAIRHVQHQRPSCAFHPPKAPKPATITDTPSQALLDVLAPLRRPAAADETPPAHTIPELGQLYANYVRHVALSDGTKATILIFRGLLAQFRPSATCLDAEHAELLKLLRGQPRKLRSVALEEFGKVRQGQLANSAEPTTPQDLLSLFVTSADGHSSWGGGGIPLADFLKHGLFGSSGRQLVGLVPDGVASVEFHYPKIVDHGRWYKPTVYPSAVTTTATVQDNVVTTLGPKDRGFFAPPPEMVWRAADGSVVQDVKPAD